MPHEGVAGAVVGEVGVCVLWECIAWRPLTIGRLLGWRREHALSDTRRVSHTHASPKHPGEKPRQLLFRHLNPREEAVPDFSPHRL